MQILVINIVTQIAYGGCGTVVLPCEKPLTESMVIGGKTLSICQCQKRNGAEKKFNDEVNHSDSLSNN